MNTDIIKNSLFKGTINDSQLAGINTIKSEFALAGGTDLRKLAYILGTVYHETGHKMQPVKEFGGETYLRSKKYYPWYGRDLVQTTWERNYQIVKDFSGVDVIKNPELIGQMPLAAKVAVHFMYGGLYTGKKLSDYFNDKVEDYINARRIINGVDCAVIIAGYAKTFYSAFI